MNLDEKKINLNYFAVFGCILSLTFFLLPFIGMEWISPQTLWRDKNSLDFYILWNIRFPRVGLAFLAGAVLSVSGMVFQSLFQNPLTTPYTLGVASGASLGAVLALWIGCSFTWLGVSATTLFACLGACGSIGMIYFLALSLRSFSMHTLLLAGIAVSFFFSSLIFFIQYLSDVFGSFKIVRWLMGGLDIIGWETLCGIFPVILLLGVILYRYLDEMDVLSLGDEIALTRGIAVQKLRGTLFLITSILVGIIVSLCGPIGFVGLIVPHACRLCVGAGHRVLFWTVLTTGGFFLAFCDTLARSLFAPAEIPVGILTALFGGPFFIGLLLKSNRQQ